MQSASRPGTVEFKPVVKTKPLGKTLTALEVTNEPVRFPGRGIWTPLLPNLWGRIQQSKAERKERIHLFEVKNHCQAFLEPRQQDAKSYFSLGVGSVDDCVVAATSEGRLEFWKYQAKQMIMVSSIQIKLKKDEHLSLGGDRVHVRRLTTDHIAVITYTSSPRSSTVEYTLFVIDTQDNVHEEHQLSNWSQPIFIPSKVNPLKYYLLLSSISNIEIIEINFDWRFRWNWCANRGKMTLKDMQGQYAGPIWDASASHVATSDLGQLQDSVSYLAKIHIFAINEKNGSIKPQLVQTQQFSVSQEHSKKYINKITLFRNGVLFEPFRNFYLWNGLSDLHLYQLADASDQTTVRDKFYDISDTEIGVVSHDLPHEKRQTLTCYESPVCQLPKVAEFLLFFKKNTGIPDSVASIAAEYAFGLFARQKANEVQGNESRQKERETQARIQEEERAKSATLSYSPRKV